MRPASSHWRDLVSNKTTTDSTHYKSYKLSSSGPSPHTLSFFQRTLLMKLFLFPSISHFLSQTSSPNILFSSYSSSISPFIILIEKSLKPCFVPFTLCDCCLVSSPIHAEWCFIFLPLALRSPWTVIRRPAGHRVSLHPTLSKPPTPTLARSPQDGAYNFVPPPDVNAPLSARRCPFEPSKAESKKRWKRKNLPGGLKRRVLSTWRPTSEGILLKDWLGAA